MTKSTYLSPSTQENNIGVENYGTEEYRMNLICDNLQKILEENNITVYRNNPNWNLKKVVDDSNSKNPDIHLALHSNANTGESRGCEIFCYKFGSEGHKLAEFIYSELEKITPSTDRGIKEGQNFYGQGKHMYELAYTTASAVLIEIAFHDNREDAEWIINNTEAISQAIANAVLTYLGIFTSKEDLELKESIKMLNEKGIINSPEYWNENAVKGKTVSGKYAGILIQRIADFINKNYLN